MPPVSAQDPPSFVKVQERNAHGVPPPGRFRPGGCGGLSGLTGGGANPWRAGTRADLSDRGSGAGRRPLAPDSARPAPGGGSCAEELGRRRCFPSTAGLEPPMGSAPSSSLLGSAGPSPSSRFRWQELEPCPTVPLRLPHRSAPFGPPGPA